jgi:hypothetical protein
MTVGPVFPGSTFLVPAFHSLSGFTSVHEPLTRIGVFPNEDKGFAQLIFAFFERKLVVAAVEKLSGAFWKPEWSIIGSSRRERPFLDPECTQARRWLPDEHIEGVKRIRVNGLSRFWFIGEYLYR